METDCRAWLDEIIRNNISTKEQFDDEIIKLRKKYKCQIKKRDLLYTYRAECAKGTYTFDQKYIKLFQTKAMRSQSGVLVIAVFTSPYPNGRSFSCEYNCHYCPNEPGQPRSYLTAEPGVRRANKNNFDAIEQFDDRANQYFLMGHPIDKIELIILGGTWSSYPKSYQQSFICELFYAANTYTNRTREMLSLDEEIKINESANSRIIGITIETRPDRITPKELIYYRTLGITRVQLGIQHTDDRLLDRVNRGCKHEHTIKAIELLKMYCFKVDIHVMPGLPQPLLPHVNPKKEELTKDAIDWSYDVYLADQKMMSDIASVLRPDQLKIYPYTVTRFSQLELDYYNGLFTLYTHQTDRTQRTKLYDLLIDFLANCPPWIRVNRVIRDIVTQDIIAGNLNVNLHNDIDAEMEDRGIFSMDIRNREVRGGVVENPELVIRAYGNNEYFISIENPKVIYGFLRLNLGPTPDIDDLRDAALIRELHVYGDVLKVNEHADKVQHMGYGKMLLNTAEELAKQNGRYKMAVISGVGVREYYRKRGYIDGTYYLVKYLPK